MLFSHRYLVIALLIRFPLSFSKKNHILIIHCFQTKTMVISSNFKKLIFKVIMTKIDFINQMNQIIDEIYTKGILFNKSVALAQAALESNWGNSELVQKANNLFSIKAGKSWKGGTIWLPGFEWNAKYGWHQSLIEWRKYPSWLECLIDYIKIINEKTWFQDALKNIGNSSMFLKSLLPNGTEPGWATDPHYYNKILKIATEIESYGGPRWEQNNPLSEPFENGS